MTEYILPPSSLLPGSTVWAYLRDSGGDGQEQSVTQQKAAITEYCNRNGLILAKVFMDVAKSGGSTVGRDSFNDMIDLCGDKNSKPSGLLLWNFARFARDLDDSSYFKALVRKQGIVIHSLTDPIPEGQYGRVIETFIDIANEEKRHQTSRDVKRALASQVKQGYSSGGFPPRGYISEKVTIGNKRDGKPRVVSRWVPDPDLWGLVLLAWKMRSEGKSYTEITRATGGKLYKSNNCWPTFFNNKTYLGIGKCGDMEIPDHHEAAITLDTWDAVQRVKEASPWYGKTGHPFHPRRKSNPSLLSGIGVCIHCGAALLHHQGHKGRNWQYYICGKVDRQRGIKECEGRRVNSRKVDEVILSTVLERILTPGYFQELIEETKSLMQDTESIETIIIQKQKDLKDVERSIRNLLDLAESFGSGAAVERLKQRESECAILANEIKQLESKRDSLNLEITPEALQMVLETWRDEIHCATKIGDVLKVKEILAKFVEKIEVGYKQAKIWYTFPVENSLPFISYTLGGTTIYGCLQVRHG
jgi:DNA invertase Pin-like site-specific DNA recombinase